MADPVVAPTLVEGSTGNEPVTPPAAPVVTESKPTEAPPPQSGEPKGQESTPAEFKIKVPEGVAVDQKLMDSYTEFVTTNKIPPEEAQKFVDAYVAAQQESIDRTVEQHTKWAEETKKELGTEFKSSIEAAKKAVQTFGDKDLLTVLNQTGLGNHKSVIKFLATIGKKVSEDKIVHGGAPAGGETPPSMEELLYPTMKK
jgi:hypothetical protein